MKRIIKGFTLIELMIVVGVIAILAAIAIASYQRYVKEAQITKLESHYDDSIRAVRSEFAKRAAQLSSGRAGMVALNEGFVINSLLNPEERTAPLGGPAYIVGASDPDLGAIGISVTNTGGKPGTEVVTIRRPAFLDESPAASVTLFANSVR